MSSTGGTYPLPWAGAETRPYVAFEDSSSGCRVKRCLEIVKNFTIHGVM